MSFQKHDANEGRDKVHFEVYGIHKSPLCMLSECWLASSIAFSAARCIDCLAGG